jgi:phosphoribosyl-AMP cyclohydrolase
VFRGFSFTAQETGNTTMIDFDKAGGLVPVIAQDADTGQVLMLAWMNREAYEETLRTGRACYFSRSRGRLWRKGEESGHVQEVREIYLDCDADTVLLKVRQVGGAACHEGYPSCFFRKLEGNVLKVVGERVFDPKQVYKK